MPEATAVAIVGAGITGLAAAFALQERGVRYLLLEASPRLGGVIRTEASGGFLVEGGPDAILTQKPEGIGLARQLGLGERLVPTNPVQRAVWVLHRKRLHPLPDGMLLAVPTRILPLARSGLFSWSGKLRMGLDLLLPARRADGDESLGAFLERRLGREAVERLGEPLMAGIHAGDPDRLSIQATFPRFVELERTHGSLIRGILASRPKSKEPPPAAFCSLPGGLAELVEAIEKRLPPERVRTASPVHALVRDGAGFTLSTAAGPVRAQAVVVTAPAPKAARLVEPLAPEAARLLAAIPFASSATVNLGYRREDVAHPLDGYGLVVPRGEGLRASACTFFSTKFPGRAPQGHVLLRVYLGGVRDPGVLELSDEQMADTAHTEMASILGLRGVPVLTRVCRWPEATPQMEVGHLMRMAELERHLAVPGLLVAGAGLRGTGIPDCVADGSKAAEAAALLVAVR